MTAAIKQIRPNRGAPIAHSTGAAMRDPANIRESCRRLSVATG
jgi:hypothetical protein